MTAPRDGAPYRAPAPLPMAAWTPDPDPPLVPRFTRAEAAFGALYMVIAVGTVVTLLVAAVRAVVRGIW